MNAIQEVIMNLGHQSCITNILENWNMGPSTYDIICPEEGKTEIYMHPQTCKDSTVASKFIENSLIELLNILETKLKQNELKFIPFDKQIRRNKSDYKVKLSLSTETQKRFEKLYQGWIICA